jgi:hypothetical protein
MPRAAPVMIATGLSDIDGRPRYRFEIHDDRQTETSDNRMASGKADDVA